MGGEGTQGGRRQVYLRREGVGGLKEGGGGGGLKEGGGRCT